MEITYNTFIEDITNFTLDSYISNKNNLFEDNFNKFYNYYLILEDEEKKKYNANIIKFKKSINDQKSVKFMKINRAPEEYKKIYDLNNIQDENEKLSIKIRSYLNKISADTYEKICTQLIDELIEINNLKIFEILSKEITTKCILDNKYRNLYINLCNKIWNNKQIHLNLINIKKTGYDYYWNVINNIDVYGPFKNETLLKNDAFKKINFKTYFLNYIQDQFYNKNINIDSLEDEVFFEEKKKILSLCELISILYINNHINFDIINIVLINLLHLNNTDKVKEIELELFHLIINNIYKNGNNNNNKFNEYNKLFNQYIETLNGFINLNISKRSEFFISEINKILNIFLNKDKNGLKNNSSNNLTNNSKINISFFDSLHNKKIDLSYNSFKKEQNFEENITKIINLVLDKTKKYDNLFLVQFLKKIKNEYTALFNNIINKIIENVEDIILDIPTIKERFTNLIQDLELNNNYIKEIEFKINKYLSNEYDDEDDEDENKEEDKEEDEDEKDNYEYEYEYDMNENNNYNIDNNDNLNKLINDNYLDEDEEECSIYSCTNSVS